MLSLTTDPFRYQGYVFGLEDGSGRGLKPLLLSFRLQVQQHQDQHINTSHDSIPLYLRHFTQLY